MTSTKALFKQMFLQKRRYANLVLLIQTFAVIFMLLMGIIFNRNNPINTLSSGFAGNENIWSTILGLGAITTFFADITFLGLMCWQNEKINLSQTWQLIPTSSSKIWLANILSSLVGCFYVGVIQVVIGLIVLIIDGYSSNINPFGGKFTLDNSDIVGFAEEILVLVGLCLIIFAFVSFTNLLTRAITDQLPIKNVAAIKLIVMAVLVIIGIVIAARINDQVTMMYYNHVLTKTGEFAKVSIDTIGVTALEYWIGSILLGIIDCLLIQNIVEPKIVNR
ncbi:ABC transporter permease [uncultured Lactobacillus sp.]|uniref:ABC transporter permease n=1 Tax=uncultured Lactobacillus sp. TaxID=153152 RepID=UPI002805B720|nr:ABC transporter permease [uncultured Lactobacillus sp.]